MLCNELENLIGYKFKNTKLLENAMTHSSYANDVLGSVMLSNERLEFLGDALLDAIVGEILFKRFPHRNEGFLTKLRAEIVCEKALGLAAFKLGLNEYLLLGNGEEERGGRQRASLVADSVEALIAAVYLDSDESLAISNIRMVVQNILGETIEQVCKGKKFTDSKTALQEKLQAKGITDIKYEITGESGPDHAKVFTAAVLIKGVASGSGEGHSKKEAESMAAHAALESMEDKK